MGYVTLCSPPANRAVKPLKWLKGLLVMVAKYPEHKSVASGLAHWQLFHAYRAFAMHEKCIEVLDELNDRNALGSYRKALEYFQLFQKQYPTDSRCKPGESGVSTLQRRIAALGVAIGRFAR